MKPDLAFQASTFDLRGPWRQAQPSMPSARWLQRIEMMVLASMGGFFGLALLLLAGKF